MMVRFNLPGLRYLHPDLGTAPNRQFVIRWKTTYFNHAGTAEFEVLLTEGSNTLSVIYGANDNAAWKQPVGSSTI